MQPIVPLKTGATGTITHELWVWNDAGEMVPAPIAGATITFKMVSLTDDEVIIDEEPVDIVQADADLALVKYELQEEDVDTAGQFYAEWHVEYDDGVTDVFPKDGYILVIIRESL